MFGDKYHFCKRRWIELLGSLDPEERESRIRSYEESIKWGESQSWPQKGLSSSQRVAAEILKEVIRDARLHAEDIAKVREQGLNVLGSTAGKSKAAEEERVRIRGEYLKGMFPEARGNDGFNVD